VPSRSFAIPQATSGGWRVLALRQDRPYDRVSPTERYYIAALGYAAVNQPGSPPTAFKREVGLRLAKLRLGWLVTVTLQLFSRRKLDAIAPRLRRLRWPLLK
jgi:hypothetical protein